MAFLFKIYSFRNYLKNLQKKCRFFTHKEHPALQETEVLHEKFKTVLQQLILKKKFSTPNFSKFLNPWEKIFFTFLLIYQLKLSHPL